MSSSNAGEQMGFVLLRVGLSDVKKNIKHTEINTQVYQIISRWPS